MHIAREAERREIVDEGGIEAAATPHPVELLGAELELLEIVDDLLKTRRHQEIASRWQPADDSSKTAGAVMPWRR